MDQSLINRIVEAALMAATQPLTLAQLHGLLPEEEPAPEGDGDGCQSHDGAVARGPGGAGSGIGVAGFLKAARGAADRHPHGEAVAYGAH